MKNSLKDIIHEIEKAYSEGIPSPEERNSQNEKSVIGVAQERLGLASSTYKRRMKKLKEEGYLFPWEVNGKREFTSPVLPSEEMTREELVDHVTRRYQKREKAERSRKWIPLRFRREGPIGISIFGDPHVDDNFCDWPKLREDLATVNEREGMYAASLGDASNNWVGRLSRIWASQETTAKQSWELVRWLLEATDWCLLVKGNHDTWLPNDVDPIEWLKIPGTLSQEWSARVEVKFPNGRSGKIWAAHDMPGHSQWNPLHAQTKRARFTQEADLYISGHKHTWALAQFEDEWTNKVYWAARAKGYKSADDYAQRLGYGAQMYGETITAIFDPDTDSPTSFLVCFANVQEAAEYLRWKRAKRIG